LKQLVRGLTIASLLLLGQGCGAAEIRVPGHAGFKDPKARWFGDKFVVYNTSTGGVHLELWLDANANDTWERVGETDDTGGWKAGDTYMNGCGKSPYDYATDQIMAWAGPYVIFRADSIAIDFKWLSVREIQPPG
jgi:hypothetical protein